MPLYPIKIKQIELEPADNINVESTIEQAIEIAKQYPQGGHAVLVTIPINGTIVSVRHDSNARLLFAHWYRINVLNTAPSGPISPYPAPIDIQTIDREFEMHLQSQV